MEARAHAMGSANELTIAAGICVAFVRNLSFFETACAVFGAENREYRSSALCGEFPKITAVEGKTEENPRKTGAKNKSWFFCDSFLKKYFHIAF